MPRSGWFDRIKDPFCALSHGVGALLAAAGIAPLIVLSQGDPWRLVSFSVYGATLVLLFAASALYHAIPDRPAVSDTLYALDRAAIHGLIAGTYTPLCLVALPKSWGWTLFGISWGMAVAGVVLDFATKRRMPDKLQALIYLCCGWVFLVALGPVLRSLTTAQCAWLAAGSVLYTAGAVLCVKEPVRGKGKFTAHDGWHAMVLAAGVCHYVFMALLASPGSPK